MSYSNVRQRFLEDVRHGKRFEILVDTEEHKNIRSTYVFMGGNPVAICLHDDANLELIAKMEQEEIFTEVYGFLRREGYDKSQPIG